MYLADTFDPSAAASKKASSKPPQTTKFGCATLPTKLKQSAAFGSGITGLRQSSAPTFMTSKSKFEAKRQTSAPQISNTLPDEVRQVYQKITSGQKVKPNKKEFGSKSGQGQVSPILKGTKPVLHREAFKPASHFSEVRGYEKAVPKQICVSY